MSGAIYKTVGVVFAALTTSGILFGGAAQATGAIAAPAPPAAQPSQASDVAPLASVLYQIAIKTGDVEDGGTDSTVSISLCGTSVCTPLRAVEDPDYDDRERGNTDYHVREWENVGTLDHIVVRQEDNGSPWYLEWIKVRYGSQTATFVWDRWMPRERNVPIDAA